MLVLSRKREEDIIIPTAYGPVTIRIVDIIRNRVRVGVLAPPEVRVDRGEVAARRAAAAIHLAPEPAMLPGSGIDAAAARAST